MKLKQMVMDGDPPFLPDEIITNILKRLPVKSLIRFRCVSKHWKNLIKTPSFVQDHLNHHSSHQKPNLLIQQNLRDHPPYFCLLNPEMQFLEFDNTMNSKVNIVGSCNGLLCFCDYNTIPPPPILWNPATKEVRQIPTSPFDPIPNGWYFGFGFSPIINDYKIVRFTMTNMIYEAEVYSLSTGTWEYTWSESLIGVDLLCDGVTVNGCIFWYGSISRYVTGTNARDVIISFDLVTEVFTVTPSPAFLSEYTAVRLSVYDDKLAIISSPWRINSQCSRAYFGVMEETGECSSGNRWNSSWKYIFDSSLFKLSAGTVWRNQIVYISHESGVEMENAKPRCRLYLINVSTNERKWFDIPGYGHYFDGCVGNYVESFVQIGNIQD